MVDSDNFISTPYSSLLVPKSPSPQVYNPWDREHQAWLLFWLDCYEVPFSKLDAVGFAMMGSRAKELDWLISELRDRGELPWREKETAEYRLVQRLLVKIDRKKKARRRARGPSPTS